MLVPGNFRLTPDDNEYPMVFPGNTFKGVLLWADTSLKDDTNNIVNEDPQPLRIVMLDEAGNVVQTEHKSVGRKLGDKPWPRLNIQFTNAAKTAEINITREGPGTKRIAFCLY